MDNVFFTKLYRLIIISTSILSTVIKHRITFSTFHHDSISPEVKIVFIKLSVKENKKDQVTGVIGGHVSDEQLYMIH